MSCVLEVRRIIFPFSISVADLALYSHWPEDSLFPFHIELVRIGFQLSGRVRMWLKSASQGSETGRAKQERVGPIFSRVIAIHYIRMRV